MKFKILILLLFIINYTNSQETLCNTSILLDDEILGENIVQEYSKYDFSNLWLLTDNQAVYGIIGEEHQRILIKLIKIEKDSINKKEYKVSGKYEIYKYGSSIVEFTGKITLTKVQAVKNPYFGVDDMYKNAGIRSQGLLTAKYEFFENQNQSNQFYGILQTKWYVDKNDNIKYNDIDFSSDNYFNNAFVGVWKSVIQE